MRYPLSGLVGSRPTSRRPRRTTRNISTPARNVELLDQNIVAWLTSSIIVDGKTIPTNERKKYADCLNAPNYTVFSNTTSAARVERHADAPVVPLEIPHNSIHLAVGGCEVPN